METKNNYKEFIGRKMTTPEFLTKLDNIIKYLHYAKQTEYIWFMSKKEYDENVDCHFQKPNAAGTFIDGELKNTPEYIGGLMRGNIFIYFIDLNLKKWD